MANEKIYYYILISPPYYWRFTDSIFTSLGRKLHMLWTWDFSSMISEHTGLDPELSWMWMNSSISFNRESRVKGAHLRMGHKLLCEINGKGWQNHMQAINQGWMQPSRGSWAGFQGVVKCPCWISRFSSFLEMSRRVTVHMLPVLLWYHAPRNIPKEMTSRFSHFCKVC